MKIRLLTLVIALFALVSCNKSTFNVKVELQNAEGKMIYLQKFVNKTSTIIDSVEMQNNIVNFTVEEENPATYYSIRIEKVRYPIGFFSENNDVTIVGDIEDHSNIQVTASYAQQLVNEYDKENKKFYDQLRELGKNYEIAAQAKDEAAMEKIYNEYDQVEKNQTSYRNLFIAKNYSSFVSSYILYNNRLNYELNELEDFVNHFNISQDNEFSKLLNEYILKLKRVNVGEPYLDFTQETPEGDLLSLSELVGKSKLLLVDFWASWCGPCRAENPNVVAVYKEYHEKGFDVLGVSLDMKKENWIKAIEDDGLIWHNVSDLKYWNNAASKDYAISSIPSNILIDENGTIIAKNLRGEDLRKKVEEILK
ncbi:MAG: AhpC/TSA family protein [Bacteroidales bacterium]|nr:AhpC/TSA family protein [Bacteroidales bacterium]